MCKDRFDVLEDWLAEVFSPLCAVEGAFFNDMWNSLVSGFAGTASVFDSIDAICRSRIKLSARPGRQGSSLAILGCYGRARGRSCSSDILCDIKWRATSGILVVTGRASASISLRPAMVFREGGVDRRSTP
jgi:hypothetical protein